MRVTFSPGNVKELQSFFKTDLAYLDMMVTRDHILLIANANDVYTHYRLSVISRDDFTASVCLRVNRSKFLNLLTEGTVVLYISESREVEFTFKPSFGGEYKMRIDFQASDISSILSRLELLQKHDTFKRIDLHSLADGLRIIRNLTKTVSVVDGMLVADYVSAQTNRTGIQIFCKTKCENLSLSTSVVAFLLRFADNVYAFQNFIIGRGESCVVIARQSRVLESSDFKKAVSAGYSHKMQVNLRQVCELVRKSGTEGAVRMDFEREIASISDDKYSYTAKFKVTDVESKRAEKAKDPGDFDLSSLDFGNTTAVSLGSVHNIPTLMIPAKIFTDLLSSLSRDILTFKIKRNFVQVEAAKSTLFVMFRRVDVA